MSIIRSDVKAQAFLDFLEKNNIGDEDFRTEIACQLSRLSHCSGCEKGFYFSVVKGANPVDQLQVMLLTQLSAAYDETLAATRRLQSAETLEQKDLCVNALTKLMRMNLLQYEAYQRLRSSHEKNITVQNVSVSHGAQAIVGPVTHNAGQRSKGVTKSALAIADAHGTAMPIIGPNEQLAAPAPIIEKNNHRASAPIRRRRRA